MATEFDTIVIGGGQTGLTVGYHLSSTGRSFLILDGEERVGDPWRKRWDSLLLFTPAGFNKLPGMDFPADKRDQFVTKDQVADFLEGYADKMSLPVLSSTRVQRLSRNGSDLFEVETGTDTFAARNVIVAMSNHQQPRVPAFAADLDPGIHQIHSYDYKNPSSISDGPALVVGMGNSGAEISYELVRAGHQTYVSGKPTAVIPFRIDTWFGRNIGGRIVRFVATKVLTTSTPMGRKARSKLLTKAAPVVRAKPKDLVAAGVERVPRVVGVRDGKPELADGRVLDVANVVWCTGFTPGFDWVDLPVMDDGYPRHVRGIVEELPGLYFCGLFFQHSLWSETFPGMPRDVRYVMNHLEQRQPSPAGTGSGAFH